MNLPVQLFEGNRDLEVVSQHVEGCEDVRPLHHLPERTPLQHLGTEDVARLLRQKANVDEDLNVEGKTGERGLFCLVFFSLLLKRTSDITASSISDNLQVGRRTAEILRGQFPPQLPEFMCEWASIIATDCRCQI